MGAQQKSKSTRKISISNSMQKFTAYQIASRI